METAYISIALISKASYMEVRKMLPLTESAGYK